MQRLLFALLLFIAIGCQPTSPSDDAPDTTADSVATTSPQALLTDKVWVEADTTGLPGVMQIFLSDGTLVMDSCWETYRLTQWEISADTLTWQEDSAEIKAQILELTETALRLRLPLRADTLEQVFRVAEVPYLCPDMES